MAQGYAGSGLSANITNNFASNTLGMSNLGNTSGTTGVVSGSNLQLFLAGGTNVTLSQSLNGSSATITIIGGAGGGGGAGTNTLGMSNLGNTSGTSGVVTGSQVQFVLAGGNNITLLQSINGASGTVTISAPHTSQFQLSANSSLFRITANDSELQFTSANSNFQSAGAYLTTAMLSNAATISNINLSGGTTSQNLSKFEFNDSNGVSFGLDGSTITATVRTDYQSAGAYLTTAMQSNAATISNINLSGGTTSQNLSKFQFNDGNGVTFGLNGSTVTASVQTNYLASQSNQALSGANGSFTFQTATFADSNGVSWSTGTQGLYATVKTDYQTSGAYLTTAMQSNAATISNVNLSAGTTSNNLSRFQFADGSGVSFGLNGSTITATVKTDYQSAGAYLTTAMQSNAATISNVNLSAGTTSGNLSKFQFNDGSGVSFGLNGSTLTASVKTDYQSSNANYLTSQSNQALSGANGSFTFQTATFANSNGVSWSTGTQGLYATVKTDYLTTAMLSNAATISNINLSAGTTSGNLSKFQFNDGGGVSFGLDGSTVTATVKTDYQSAGAYLTTAMLSNAATISNVNLSAGTTSQNLSRFVFADAGGVSFGLNGSTITASAPAAGGGLTNINLSAGTTSQNLSKFEFANSNGVSFGLSGSTITASAAAGGGGGIALANSQTTYTSGTANLIDGFGAITIASTTGQKFNFSVPATSSLSATGIVSISTNGSTISIGAPGGLTLSYYNPQDAYVQVAGQQGNGTLHFQPMQAPNVTFDRIMLPVIHSFSNVTSTRGYTMTYGVGIYTRNASTLSLLTSWGATENLGGGTMGTANSSLYGVLKLSSMPVAGGYLLTEGQYWVGHVMVTSMSGFGGMSVSQVLASQQNSNLSGMWGAANNATVQYTRGLGHYSASTAALPSAVPFSDIRGTASIALRQPVFYFVSGTV